MPTHLLREGREKLGLLVILSSLDIIMMLSCSMSSSILRRETL